MMEEFEIQERSSKGIFCSKIRIIILTAVILTVILVEGLLIGLVGRPTCSSDEIVSGPQSPTSPTVKPVDPNTATDATTWNDRPSSDAPTIDSTVSVPWNSLRLPLNLIPIEYEISLRPVLKPDASGKYLFYGSSEVWYRCEIPTKYLIIHSNKLEYERNSFSLTQDGNVITIKNQLFYTDNHYLVVETDVPCETDKIYKFSTPDFTGELADDLEGFYRSEYVKADGSTKVIATSQMQTLGARKTFPCFDEPLFKAKFNITLWYEQNSGYFAISNMPGSVTKTQDIDSVTWEGRVFEETVPMSTYLLALVVCDFNYTQSFTESGVQTRIYARNEAVANKETEYAEKISPQILDFFESYFNVSYPLPKSDQLGVPDFEAGAMENWGLVIYRERLILYDEERSSIFDKLSLTSIVSHELAHQWFGNLVSPKWWDDLWLNEGFATYISYVGEAAVQPKWESFSRFLSSEMRDALSVDSLTSSHPLVTEVNTPAEIQAQFDTISYNKGGSILRMTNAFLGETTFVRGLTNYLKAFAYNASTHEDLFEYWQQQAEADNVSLPTSMSIIMETWTLQMGYPVINCTRSGNTWTITQQYFLLNPTATPVQTDGSLKYGYKWYVPFTYKTMDDIESNKEETKIWIEPNKTETITYGNYILGNINAMGYYRVNYDEATWQDLTLKLNSSSYQEISQENRAQLISDVFHLATAKQLPFLVALELSTYLWQELSYVPWEIFLDDISYVENMLGRTPAYGAFEKYIQKLVKPSIYKTFGYNEPNKSDDYQVQRMTTNTAVHAACYYGDLECIETATKLFAQWMTDPTNSSIISTTYRTDVYCTAIRNGGVKEWDFAWERFTASNNAQEQASLRYGMACSKEPWILSRYLQYCLDSTKIRKQDVVRTIEYVGRQEYGHDIAWAFMVENWDLLLENFGNGWSFDSLILSLSNRFSTEYELNLLEDLKSSTTNLGTASRAVDQAIEITKVNIAWRKENEADVTQWLNELVAI